MPPAPIIAVKGTQMASERVSKALTGDIYTRRWQTVKTKGKGKKKQTTVTEHELRVNPVGVGAGVAAIGVGALALGAALWMSQLKVQPNGVAETRTVVDQPRVMGHFERKLVHVGPQGMGYKTVWVDGTPEVSHQEPTGRIIKKFSVEQRRGFSFTDVVDSLNPLGSIGKKPIFGSWAHGQILAGGPRLW